MLHIVPTPIGNLKDITARALDVLKSVDLILAEDTRVTLKLLRHFEIGTPIKSYHAHNEHRSTAYVIEQLKSGKEIALVSDAGTPGISDPGFMLVRSCIEEKVEVDCLPGPTAFVPAIVMSGFPCDRFYYEGFLPTKKGRNKRWLYLATLADTIILYESPHRIQKCVEEIMEHFSPSHPISICREISKIHQECIRGTAEEVHLLLAEREKLKGEIVVVLDRRLNTKKASKRYEKSQGD